MLLIALGLGVAVPAQPPVTPVSDLVPVKGAWISPDWLFPGPASYTEEQVRSAARQTINIVSSQGINHVFLETTFRGTTICPPLAGSPGNFTVLDEGQNRGFPVFTPLQFPVRIEGGYPVDTLQIFIEEGRKKGVRVHAWVHMYYWRMDNSDVIPSWKEGRTGWDDLLAQYLRTQKDALGKKLGVDHSLVKAIDGSHQIIVRGYNGLAMNKVLEENGVPTEHNPLGSLLRAILKAGGDAPDFLLIGDNDDPFPAPNKKVLRPIYVDPEHPRVSSRQLGVIRNIVMGHPGLAGVHLDHIRYPKGAAGTPPELQLGAAETLYFDPGNEILAERYKKAVEILQRREEVLKSFVSKVRRLSGPGMQLSAAIVPQYHRQRADGRFRITLYDFTSQDWYNWDVDFVVPMMYEVPAWKIRNYLIRYREDLARLYGDEIPIRIYPGVSRLQMAQSGILNQDDWVFFDLTLANDVKVERAAREDVDVVGPQDDPPMQDPDMR